MLTRAGLMVAAAILGTVPAVAGELRIDTRCHRGSCQTSIYEPGPGLGKAVDVPHEFDAEKDARWENYCHPKIVVDALGVNRYVYAHAGCEFGRTE